MVGTGTPGSTLIDAFEGWENVLFSIATEVLLEVLLKNCSETITAETITA